MQLDSQLPVAPGALISGVQQVSPSAQGSRVPLAQVLPSVGLLQLVAHMPLPPGKSAVEQQM
ncbi:MAG: hypothetical protein RL698_813 [Pseudomonadota bacterium]